ncbi:MAG: efflux RND transporter periplasmic adaptor subunit [Bacteroidota bacterium]
MPRLRCFALLLVAVTLVACGDDPPPEVPLRPVRAIAVGYGQGDAARTFSGTAETDRVINLSFRSSGIITAFNMDLGQRVQRGQLLAQLDNVQARLAQEQAVSSLNSAASQMSTAKLNLDRVRTLYEKGSASLSDYENAKNSFRTAEAGYESAQRSVDIQEEQIRYGFLYAPATGTIAAVYTEAEENVGAGQAVAQLHAGTTMQIELGLPENVITQVTPGLDATVTFTSLPGRTFAATVREVSPSVDPQTATYPVRVTLTDPSDDVRSGMSANVTFGFGQDDQASDVLVVPAKAVGEDSEGQFVFLLDGGSGTTATASKHRIEVGRLTATGFEVVAGLEPGQRIATAGLQTLLDGQAVIVRIED